MKEKFGLLKKVLFQYRMTVFQSVVNAMGTAVPFVWPYAIYKIKSLEIGKYPEEPAEIVSARLQAMRPVILRHAVLIYLLLTIILFIVLLFWRFKRRHNINLIRQLRTGSFDKD